MTSIKISGQRWQMLAMVIVMISVMVAVFFIFMGERGNGAGWDGLKPVAEGFNSPIHLESPPDDSGRRMIVDREGVVYVLMPDSTVLSDPFLDIRDRMMRLQSGYDERGLLGFTFHPDFAENGTVYVHYSAPLRSGAPSNWDHTSHISKFNVSADDPNTVDLSSECILLQIDQPQFNHNGGTIAFGPDGFLYIGVGDGGGGNDQGLGHSPVGNGQDVTTLLGKILRIDAEGGVPADNPWVGKEGLNEIYAWGFRNPYRFSFDRGGDKHLFVADVGQNLWEEINIVKEPGNFGWRVKEGSYWFDAARPNAIVAAGEMTGHWGEPYIDPVIEYGHPSVAQGANDITGISIIGGYVYRGSENPEWYGKYVFGDWSMSFQHGSGKIFVATPPDDDDNTEWTVEEVASLNEFILGFGEDADGELYVLTTRQPGPSGRSGQVYKMSLP